MRDTLRDTETRNTACSAVGEGFWGFGWGLANALTVLPLLIEGLGGGKVEVGLVGTVAAACSLLPQVFGSFILQHGRGRKRFLVLYHLAVIIPLWGAMGLATLLFAPTSPFTARVLLQVLFAAFLTSAGFIMPVWLDWVAGLTRPKRRGALFGWSSAASAVGGTAAALVAGVVTGAFSFPLGYCLLILAGTVPYTVSILSFIPAREIQPEPAARISRRGMFSRFKSSLSEPNFRRYLVARLLLTAGSGPVAFFAVHYKSAEGGSVAPHMVIGLGAALTVSQAVTGVLLGRLGDVRGHKLGAILGASAQAAAVAVAVLVPGVWSCAAVLALTGAGFASAWVSHQNMLFETCPHDCRTAHITASNLVLAPLTALVPVATGWAVGGLGTQTAFLVCLAPTALGLGWLLFAVKEPRVVRAL